MMKLNEEEKIIILEKVLIKLKKQPEFICNTLYKMTRKLVGNSIEKFSDESQEAYLEKIYPKLMKAIYKEGKRIDSNFTPGDHVWSVNLDIKTSDARHHNNRIIFLERFVNEYKNKK